MAQGRLAGDRTGVSVGAPKTCRGTGPEDRAAGAEQARVFTFLGTHRDWACPLLVVVGGRRGRQEEEDGHLRLRCRGRL